MLLKHMGSAAASADLYVASGMSTGDVIEPYARNQQTGDRYVKRIKNALRSRNGKSALVDGCTVWCFHVEGEKVSATAGKAQALGAVTANGPYDVAAVGFDYFGPGISVELKSASK